MNHVRNWNKIISAARVTLNTDLWFFLQIFIYPNMTTLLSDVCYRKSVCRLSSVCNVCALCSGRSNFRQYFFPFCTLAILWPGWVEQGAWLCTNCTGSWTPDLSPIPVLTGPGIAWLREFVNRGQRATTTPKRMTPELAQPQLGYCFTICHGTL